MENIKDLISAFKDYGNMFKEDGGQLFDLDTAKIMSDDVINSVKNIYETGREAYLTFKSERILSQDKYWTDKATPHG